MNKEKWKYYQEYMDMIISGMTLGMVWLLGATFMYAFFQPGMKTVVAINEYGEAWFELPIIILIGVGAIRNLIRQVEDIDRWNKNE
jgi:hypothetical protein